MSTAEVTSNKATFKRFQDAVNTCDLQFISKTIDELVEPDATIRTPLPGDATGAQKLKQVWTVLLQAFPDLQLTIEDLIGEDDKVVARIVCTGTHSVNTWAWHRAANPLRTKRSSSSASPTAVWLRPGESSTSSRR